MPNSFYSFGVAHPGAITLHNYPKFLQTLKRADGSSMDLAAIDIMRVRERGVPRYNEFRRLWHLEPAASFEDLTQDKVKAQQLSRVYDGDIEQRGPDGRPLRGAPANRLRLQRHGVPRLHPDGVAASEERSLLHR